MTPPPCTIRAALPADEATWRQLWRGYCDFYRVHLSDDVDGQVYGFANCVVHENTWETQAVCYLEDLFVVPSARGHGIGAALIEWLRNAMRAEGWARLYWVTKADNHGARRLYDRFARADGFVRYVLQQK